jgi:H+/Na+-translocating ferredoxin:NAD+ oxidoreductase subunit B
VPTAAATDPTLAERIDAWLPQTQCGVCGYASCRDYAVAVATGRADFNQCPPGGTVTIQALATLLDRAPKPLNPAHGLRHARERAIIVEADCIGCRKCLDVCPVDAVLGASKQMHTILARECNGCALCVPHCPVNCIVLQAEMPAPHAPWPEYDLAETAHWRQRAEARRRRLAGTQHAAPAADTPPRHVIRDEIRAAVERVRARKERHGNE